MCKNDPEQVLYVLFIFFIFQEFNINSVQDLALIFDHIMETIIDPVVDVVQAFKTLIQLFDNGIEYIINKIIEVVKNFPLILEDVVQKLIDGVLAVIDFGGSPWIEQIKKIIIKARYFVEDIKEDITNFYSVCQFSYCSFCCVLHKS